MNLVVGEGPGVNAKQDWHRHEGDSGCQGAQGNAESEVPFGEIVEQAGSRAGRATGDDYQTDRNGIRKFEQLGHAERESGHNQVLG